MEHYELMFVLPGSLDPATVPAIQARVDGYIQTATGTITTTVDLDRRRLAYNIGQQTHGYYQVRQFDLERGQLKELDQKLRLDNDVLRYMVVKAPAMTADQIKQMIAGEKYKVVKATAVVSTEAKTSVTALTEEEKMFAEANTAKVETDTEKNKVSIEELDKKLDAILEDTDLASKL
jgi:small subunit ribosomal protein S6